MTMFTPPAARGRLWRLMHRYHFESEDMELLYHRFSFRLQLGNLKCLIVLLIVLLTVLAVLNFVFVSHTTLENICFLVLCVLFVILLVFVHTKFMKHRFMLLFGVIVLSLCILFAIICYPINFASRGGIVFTPADGVWQVVFVVFVTYAMLPLRIYVALTTGILLPVGHIVASILLTESAHMWRQVTANILIYIAVNIIGVYIHDRTEHAQRKAFLDARNCISSRLNTEDENEKTERLLQCMLPPHIATEMKKDLAHPTNDGLFHKTYTTRYDHVSILFGEIVQMTGFSTQVLEAHDMTRVLNELIGRFDQLSSENHCMRVKLLGDCYFCVAGLPEPRPDHAKCCVEMGLDMVDTIAQVRDCTGMELGMRVGVHSGRVWSGVIGTKKWQYDVWSDDVVLAKQLSDAGTCGKVQISKATLDHLQGEFDVEVSNGGDGNPYLKDAGVDTFFILTNRPKKMSSLVRNTQGNQNRLSFKNMSNMIGRLAASINFKVEVPFTNVFNAQVDDKMSKSAKTSERLLRPFNASENSYRLPMDRVHRFLAHTISLRNTDKNKSDHVNFATLRFKKKVKEKKFQKQEDYSFPTAMLCSLIMLVLTAAVQAIVLPRTLLLMILFVLSFAWIAVILILYLGARLRCLDCDIQRSLMLHIVLVTATVLFISSTAQVNVFCCRGGIFFPHFDNRSHQGLISFNKGDHLNCDMPQYIILSGIMGYLVVALFMKMVAIVKLVLMVLIAAGYILVLTYTHPGLFRHHDMIINPDIPTQWVGIVALLHILVTIYLQCRHFEWLLRLGFLWRDQSMDERQQTVQLQSTNRDLLHNMLPTDVAAHFIEHSDRSFMDIYSHIYNNIAIGFATICNFSELTLVQELNSQGAGNFGKLHHIISSFDELLETDRYRGIEKVKTFGATYVIASGIGPNNAIQETEDSMANALSQMVDMIYAFKDKLRTINENPYNNFMLRVGINLGPAVAGVVGSKKPQYDLWGDTVDLAEHMDLLSKPDCIQVTEQVHRILKDRYDFHCRGPISINGKGDVTTFFLIGQKTGYNPSHHGSISSNMSQYGTDSKTQWKRLSRDSAKFKIPFFDNKAALESPSGSYREGSFPRFGDIPTGIPSIQIPGPRSRVPSDESPKLTPPSSLSRKRGNPGSGTNLRSGVVRKSSNTSLTNFLLPPTDPNSTRVESPDLPLIHYRNLSMQPTNGSLGKGDKSNNLMTTLTQSQILNPVRDEGEVKILNAPPTERSDVVTPPSARSSVETVTSMVSATADSPLRSRQNMSEPALSKSNSFNGAKRTNGHPQTSHSSTAIYSNLPMIEESSRESRISQFSTDDPHAELTCNTDGNAMFTLGIPNGHHSPTRSELSEIDGIMREIGFNDGRSSRGSSSDKNMNKYKNKKSSGLIPAKAVRSVNVKNAPRISLLKRQDAFSNSSSDEQTSLLDQQENYPDSPNGKREIVKSELYSPGSGELPGVRSDKRGVKYTSPTLENIKQLPHVRAMSGYPYNFNISGNEESQSVESEGGSPPPLPPPPAADALFPTEQYRIQYNGFIDNQPNGAKPKNAAANSSAFRPVVPARKDSIGIGKKIAAEKQQESTFSFVPVAVEDDSQFYKRPPPLRQNKSNFNRRHTVENGNVNDTDKQTEVQNHNNPDENDNQIQNPDGSPKKTRPVAPPYQVKRRQAHRMPKRLCRSLDYIPSDIEEIASLSSSRAESPSNMNGSRQSNLQTDPFPLGAFVRNLLPDNISLSSVGSGIGSCSEMSRSDPALNYDSGSAAYESEYDNYRPGMASDEDYFVPDPISDIDIDLYDDINVDNVTVSDSFSIDHPLSFHSNKRTTEV